MKVVKRISALGMLLAMLLVGTEVLALDHVEQCYGGTVENPNC